MREKNHIYTPILGCVILLLLILSRYADSTVMNRENESVIILLLQCVIFAIPSVIYTRLVLLKADNPLKVRIPAPASVLPALLGTVILISGALLYGMITSSINVSAPSAFTLYDLFTAKRANDVGDVFSLIIIYALVPSFFEEFVFRGVISSSYESISPVCGVLMSSLMFGFIHLDLRMLPFHIFAGIILSLTMYATRSIFVSVVIHMLYNLFFIFFPSYISAIYSSDSAFFFFLPGIIFFLSLAFFSAECKRIYKRRAQSEALERNVRKEAKVNIIEVFLSPSAVVCYLIYFTAIFLLNRN